MSLIPLPLECITVSGSPAEMGWAQGERLRDRIRALVAVRFEAVEQYSRERGSDNAAGLLDVARESAAIAARWDPDGYTEHVAIAEAAGIDPIALYAATNMTDMRDVLLLGGAADEGCTAALVPASRARGGRPVVGQTWDLNPEDVEFVVAVHRRPNDAPQTWSVTCAGCLSLVGINVYGLAVGTTNIRTHGARPGVGYLGVLHRALREADAESASAVIETAPIAGAHTYWVADADRQIEWEASPRARVRREAHDAPICRSNHCLTDVHKALEGETPSPSSFARFARVEALLAGDDIDADHLRSVFADREDGVHSINRYAEDDQGTATNAVFIADLSARKAWACRGPADRGRWEELRFDDAG